MGMYTKFTATIRIPLNEKSKNLLNYINLREFEVPFSNHEFFGCQRYGSLIGSSEVVQEQGWGYSEESSRILKIDADLKNYHAEINKFCDFISEYTEDKVLGFSLYEECEAYEYHYNSRSKKEK